MNLILTIITSKLTSLPLIVLFSSLVAFAALVSGTGYKCKRVECGCQFENEFGTFEISMKNISKKSGHAYFTNVKDKSGKWIYGIDPCYGYYDGTSCQHVAMCKVKTDQSNHIPVAKPYNQNYGDYEEGKPLQVTYRTYEYNNVVRQLILYLNYGHNETTSDVSQSSTSSTVDQYTVSITSSTLAPQQISGPRTSSTSGGLSIGSVIVIAFFVVIVIYLVAGILFMKYKRGATGKEVIPNVEFWSSLPGLIKDGCVFFGKKIKELCKCCCQNEEYTTLE